MGVRALISIDDMIAILFDLLFDGAAPFSAFIVAARERATLHRFLAILAPMISIIQAIDTGTRFYYQSRRCHGRTCGGMHGKCARRMWTTGLSETSARGTSVRSMVCGATGIGGITAGGVCCSCCGYCI